MSKVKQTDYITSEAEDAEETDVPEGIIKFLQKRNGMISSYAKSRYWVSDIGACTRKTYYRALGIEKEELKDATLEGMWGSVRGDFLHQGLTEAYKWRELDIEYPVRLKDGREAVLVGRIDMYDWKEKTIIDLKTTKSIKWQIKNGYIPQPEHIVQHYLLKIFAN